MKNLQIGLAIAAIAFGFVGLIKPGYPQFVAAGVIAAGIALLLRIS